MYAKEKPEMKVKRNSEIKLEFAKEAEFEKIIKLALGYNSSLLLQF